MLYMQNDHMNYVAASECWECSLLAADLGQVSA